MSENGVREKDARAEEAEDRARFDRIKKMPRHWFEHSETLRLAATALWASSNRDVSDSVVRVCGLADLKRPSVFVRPVFLMLCGLSLELLVKAIFVAQRHEGPPKGHNLLKLYELVGLKISGSEQALLDVLTGAIKWLGKYPVPIEAADLGRYVTQAFAVALVPSGAEGTFKNSGALDWPSLDALWKKGETAYLSTLRSDPAVESQ
jgi:hypothetical protein